MQSETYAYDLSLRRKIAEMIQYIGTLIRCHVPQSVSEPQVYQIKISKC